MDLEYLPGGRWARLLVADGWSVVPVGRWHLAVAPVPVAPGASRVALVCGRELRTTGARGSEIASIAGLPHANACPVCERAWVRELHVGPRRGRSLPVNALA